MPNVIPILGQTDWLAWRSSGIGASEAGAVCGQNPYRTPLDVYLEKTGQGTPFKQVERMEWGHRLEPAVAQCYSDRTGEIFDGDQVCYEDERYPFIRATVDRTTISGKILEIKCCGIHSAMSIGQSGDTESLPAYWILQAQQQMRCAERDRVDFAVFLPDLEMRIFPVKRDEDLIQTLVELECEFWDRVQNRNPPPPENPADSVVLSKLRPVGGRIAFDSTQALVLDRYYDLGTQAKEIETEREVAKACLLDYMGENQYADLPDGRTFCRSVSEIAERTTTTNAYKRVNLSIRKAKKGN